MSIREKIQRYQGTRDERIVAEMNKVYKNGFLALSFGLLIFLYYGMMKAQVAVVNDVSDAVGYPVSELLLYAWFFVVLIACVVTTTRKGFVDDGRFAETDYFPVTYFMVWAGGAGLGAGILAIALRVVAEIELVGVDGIMWVADIALGIILVITVFLASFLGYYLSFRAAKRRRTALSSHFDD